MSINIIILNIPINNIIKYKSKLNITQILS